MKNRLLIAILALVWGATLGLHAQAGVTIVQDVTSKLANADFKADTPVTQMICTYDYDMETNGTSLFGQQTVTGWTASHPSDNVAVPKDTRTDGANAKAAGIFALVDPDVDEGPGLGSAQYKAPYANAEAQAAGITGPVLGMVAVWGSDFNYTQDVTLPAGDYMLLVTYYNVGDGTTVSKNNNGFVTESEDYYSERTEFPLNVWEQDTIIFRLTTETAGKVSLGLAFSAGSGSAPHLFIDNVKLYQINSSYIDQKAIDEAKAELLALIELGEAYGVDVTDSRAVYNNPNATLEEVLAAIENQKTLNDGGITDLSEFFISNPKFSEGTPVEGGICTYDYDCEKNGIATTNYSLLSVPGWEPNNTTNGRAGGVYAVGSNAFLGGAGFLPPKSLSDGRTEANLLGVVTCWSATAQYTQMATLPAGRYSISISYHNVGGANAVAKNWNGFIADDGTEYLGTMTTYPVGNWASETIEFELEEETSGYFSLGYQSTSTGSGNMPHLFVDGFSLLYVGTGIDPSMLALNSAVNQGLKLLDENFNAELKARLEALIEAGQILIDEKSTDSDANTAASKAIVELFAEVKASIAAYTKLQEFLENDLALATEKYDATNYAELNEQLSDLMNEVESALNSGSWTTEQIEEAIASLPTLIKTAIQKLWDEAVASGATLAEDLDISALFEQLAYTYSTSAVSNTSVPDKEWNYGDATNFKTQYGTAEVWNQSPFTVSRTLSDLPAGKYIITTKAFFRNADNPTNFASYDEANTPEANLFAGSVKVGLANVATLAGDEQLTGWTAANGDEAAPYVPNSQEAAYNLFNDDAYTDLVERSAATVLTSKGNLNFGVTADEMQGNSWVVWYSFSVKYNAFDRNDLLAVLESLDAQASALDYEVLMVEKATAGLNAAMNAYSSLAANASSEELQALIKQYEDAIAYARESLPLIAKLNETLALYTEYLMLGVDSDEPTYIELLGNIEAALSDGFESNEQIQGFIDGLTDGWAPFVQYPVLETASLEEPGDITAVIYNAGFVDPVSSENNANGWDITYEGGSTGAANDTYEFYNNDNFQISQTIKGLAGGYYRIRVQAFYRPGDNKVNADTLVIDPEYGKYVQFFGQTESTNQFTSVKNVLDRADEDGVLNPTAIGLGTEVAVAYGEYEEFYVPNDREAFAAYCDRGIYWNELDVHVAAGETLTLGLRKSQHVASDWCPFDNFQLFYLGTVAPDGIESVQGDGTMGKAPVAIYNLAGQRVNKAVKGLYIINGKKVLVK